MAASFLPSALALSALLFLTGSVEAQYLVEPKVRAPLRITRQARAVIDNQIPTHLYDYQMHKPRLPNLSIKRMEMPDSPPTTAQSISSALQNGWPTSYRVAIALDIAVLLFTLASLVFLAVYVKRQLRRRKLEMLLREHVDGNDDGERRRAGEGRRRRGMSEREWELNEKTPRERSWSVGSEESVRSVREVSRRGTKAV